MQRGLGPAWQAARTCHEPRRGCRIIGCTTRCRGNTKSLFYGKTVGHTIWLFDVHPVEF